MAGNTSASLVTRKGEAAAKLATAPTAVAACARHPQGQSTESRFRTQPRMIATRSAWAPTIA